MSVSIETQASETVTRVVGRGPSDLVDAAKRLAALQALQHPGVCIPEGIGLDADGVVVAMMPRIWGEDAAVVLRLKGGLSAGECVAIGINVAEALAAMHASGLAHGDVSPSNIVVSPTGAVLVDVLSGARVGERGTVGFASPERARGATPAGDVYSLGRVLEALVGDDARERMAAWVEPLCRPDPSARPSAEVAARALRECAEPTPVSIPMVSVAAAVRARAVEPEGTTVRLPSGRYWRARRTLLTSLRRCGFAVVGLLVLMVVVRLAPTAQPQPTQQDPPYLPPPAGVYASAPDDAAQALVESRIKALAESDSEALLASTTFDGSARSEDQPLSDRLASGDLRYEGLDVEVVSSETLSVEGDRATVRVSYHVLGHTVWDGGKRIDVPTTTAVVDYDILKNDGKWSIECTRPSL